MTIPMKDTNTKAPVAPPPSEETLALKRELMELVEREQELDRKAVVWAELDREVVSAVRWFTRLLRGGTP